MCLVKYAFSILSILFGVYCMCGCCHCPHVLLESCIGVLWFCISYEFRTAALQLEKGNRKGVLRTEGRTQTPPLMSINCYCPFLHLWQWDASCSEWGFYPHYIFLIFPLYMTHCMHGCRKSLTFWGWPLSGLLYACAEGRFWLEFSMHTCISGDWGGNSVGHSSHITLIKIQIRLCWGEQRVWQIFESSGCYIFAIETLILDLKNITPCVQQGVYIFCLLFYQPTSFTQENNLNKNLWQVTPQVTR